MTNGHTTYAARFDMCDPLFSLMHDTCHLCGSKPHSVAYARSEFGFKNLRLITRITDVCRDHRSMFLYPLVQSQSGDWKIGLRSNRHDERQELLCWFLILDQPGKAFFDLLSHWQDDLIRQYTSARLVRLFYAMAYNLGRDTLQEQWKVKAINANRSDFLQLLLENQPESYKVHSCIGPFQLAKHGVSAFDNFLVALKNPNILSLAAANLAGAATDDVSSHDNPFYDVVIDQAFTKNTAKLTPQTGQKVLKSGICAANPPRIVAEMTAGDR